MDVLRVGKKLYHLMAVRAPRLLPMLYTPGELAEELGLSSRTIREWTRKGMPHQRDAKGYLWIQGREFAQWFDELRRSAKHHRLKENEAYCLRCRQVVTLTPTETKQVGKMILKKGRCPQCGGGLNRGARL